MIIIFLMFLYPLFHLLRKLRISNFLIDFTIFHKLLMCSNTHKLTMA